MAVRRGKYEALINTRGPREGECNICGTFSRLTVDHTPPKSCLGSTTAEMHALHVGITGRAAQPGRRFRTGPSYRTICGRCNNDLLGANYDPALAFFCTEVRRATFTKLQLPDAFAVKIQPQLVMRSVLGHLAAMGVGRYFKGEITAPLRDYMLDMTLPLPEQIRFYYWLYPYRPQILVRDSAFLHIRTQVIASFWLMKFYPLAFLVTFDEPQARQFQVATLDIYRNVPHDSWHVVGVKLRPVVHQNWPEAPGDDYIILSGDQAVIVDPLNRILRP